MTVFKVLKGTVNTAVDTISTVTQALVEKNKTNAKLNRLRLIMKNESELMNRAYIALGKQYFEMQKTGEYTPTEAQEKLFAVVESSKQKIAKARECYRKIIDSQNDIFYGQPAENASDEVTSDEIVDITVACSNENEYASSPFSSENTEPEPELSVQPESETETVQSADNIAYDTDASDDTESTDEELF